MPADQTLPTDGSQKTTGAPSLSDTIQDYYRATAPYIQQELADRGDEAFWSSLAREHHGASVLELGAGSGRVTALFAREARSVVALDLSPDMLALAQARLGSLPNVRLLAADMRTFEARGSFDLIIATDDPLSHLVDDADRAATLRTVARHLNPGGTFILDALWLPPKRRRGANAPGGETREHEGRLHGRHLRVVEHWRNAHKPNTYHVAYQYFEADDLAAEATFTARSWTIAELDRQFKVAGLRVQSLWGTYARDAWTPASERLIVSAH